MSPVVQVQVSDEVAERMVRKLQLVNLHPEAACMAVLLRDRSDLRREVSGAGGDVAASSDPATVCAVQGDPGRFPTQATPAPLTSPSPDTSTIRAALESAHKRATREEFTSDALLFRDALEGLDRLAARLEAAERDRDDAQRKAEDALDTSMELACEECLGREEAAEARAEAAEAALGAARERIRELESEAGGRRSASPSSECPVCQGSCATTVIGEESCRACHGTGVDQDAPHYLCCNCGEITPASDWLYLQYDEGRDDGTLRPSVPPEADPVMRCPKCLYDHRDDYGPGVYDGNRVECERARATEIQTLRNDYGSGVFEGDAWAGLPPQRDPIVGRSPDTMNAERSSPGSASRIHELETSLRAAREALRAIAENAEAWHGPPPDMGHVRALAVIATTARGALAGGDNAAEEVSEPDRAYGIQPGQRGEATADMSRPQDPGRAPGSLTSSEPPSEPEKLVRDNYRWLAHRVAGAGERYGLLAAKLDEEVAEVKSAAIGTHDFVAELGDLVEVCYALGGRGAVEEARIEKFEKRGGSDRLIVMKLSDRTDQDGRSEPPSESSEPS